MKYRGNIKLQGGGPRPPLQSAENSPLDFSGDFPLFNTSYKLPYNIQDGIQAPQEDTVPRISFNMENDPGMQMPEDTTPLLTNKVQPNKQQVEKPKTKLDPYFTLRGASTGLNWLSNMVERKRQNQYMYDQYSTLGQTDPANVKDYQPTSYNPYMQQGGEVKDFYTSFMDSPMYNKMLTDPKVKQQRQEQLTKYPSIQSVDPSEFKDANLSLGMPTARYDKPTNSVMLNNKLPKGMVPTNVLHEISHQLDNAGEFIPEVDLNKIKSLQRPGVPNQELFNYLSQPTEVRARLNQIRFRGKENSVYDPNTQPFEKDYMNKYRTSQPMNDLRKIYDDDQIVELLNSVSKTDSKQLPIAKKGGRMKTYNC